MALYARMQPEVLNDAFYQQRREVPELPLAILKRFIDQIPHPSPQAALRMGALRRRLAPRERSCSSATGRTARSRPSRWTG
ncbi:MAG TPA: hypothetical protein VEQ60_30650 [Longimicrobium sp.]|nr:hypothetical protein [Longimicrobium sp.]